MTIKIGTIQEMTGDGYEILVDAETRSYVLAKFFNGKFMGQVNEQPTLSGCEKTLVS